MPHSHYTTIGQAIAYLNENRFEQPTLADVAQHCGLSETHFQKVFSQWVGVSPQRYLQYLTLDHAKRLLADHHNVLDTSLETGLSGPSRLHDLFLRWEAMSPGTYAQKGKGLKIFLGEFDSPFGGVIAAGTEKGICGLAFSAEFGRDVARADLMARWPDAQFEDNPAALEDWITGAFTPRGKTQMVLIGAPFQIKVWEALMRIPSGEVTTYSDIARQIGSPRAVRAVGTAVGRNPISWLIPCHRALRKSGGLGGYHWGLPVKRAMLAYEAARRDAA